jgi:hypothetical protein
LVNSGRADVIGGNGLQRRSRGVQVKVRKHLYDRFLASIEIQGRCSDLHGYLIDACKAVASKKDHAPA